LQRLAAQCGAQVGGQQRALADGVDPGAGEARVAG
jgi:hypothetical protein